MIKEIEFNTAVIEVLENGHMRIFLNPSYSIPSRDIVLNYGMIEFDEKGERPVAIYGYKVNYQCLPVPRVGVPSTPLRYTEEQAKKFCKYSLKEVNLVRLKWSWRFPFFETYEEKVGVPKTSNVRYKKVDDFYLGFGYNCNVSIYEGDVIGKDR